MARARVVDSHVHFWDPVALTYPWLDGNASLQRLYIPIDYAPLVSHDVDAVVFVEANCAAGETEQEITFVDDLARAEPRIAGSVAFIDLFDEERLGTTLEKLSQRDRVVGVRHNIQGHGAGYCTSDVFVRGVERVGQSGLPFDLCASADQLGDVAHLVGSCPDTQFVLDHCGKPAIRDDAFESWALDIVDIAVHENVACKLSGLLTETRADQRSTDALSIYAEHVLACFGPSRLMYGTDWPVVTLVADVSVWRKFTDQFTVAWDPADRQRFYADNAIRLYGLELHAYS
jgi:L-fuconolactonase